MQITEVKLFPVRDKKLRAFASIVFDASFMVNDIKVIEGKDGLFISMPSRRRKNGRFKDIAHPLNQETRQVIEDRILAEYQRVAEGGEAAPAGAAVVPSDGESVGADAAMGAAEGPVSDPAASRPGDSMAASPPEAAEAAVPAPVEEAADAARKRPGKKQREATEADDKSLDEVAEAHLSDSYWTT